MPDDKNLTPMMQQYLKVKAEAPKDAVLLFRMGDFYEMFFNDAKVASPILEIALTSRAGYPMCGVPYHALDLYLPKLLEAGVKVAIAEQLENPALVKGNAIVKRGITRVITPGSITEGPLLKPSDNNFLCSYYSVPAKNIYALSWLDISTGEFLAAEFSSIPEAADELAKLHPRECVAPASLLAEWKKDPSSKPETPQNMLWTELDDWIFSYENAFGLLTRHFGTLTLEGFGFKQKEADAVRAAGAVLAYTEDNLKCQTGHIRKISLKSRDEVLLIDPSSRRNLELADPMLGSAKDSTLLHVLDCSKTPMGGRLLRQWVLNPLRSVDRIVERQDIVGTFKDDPLTLAELRETISGIRDLARITTKLNMNTANPRDLIALSASLALIPGVKNILAIFDLPLIADVGGRLGELAELTTRIHDTLVDLPPATANDGGVIREGCNAELDELRSAATEGRNWVARLQAKEQERTGIKNLKVHYNRVFGFYIEVTKANLENVPDDYIRKQTLVNCERFITPELKEMESKILGADDKAKALEIKLFEELRAYAAGFTREIQQNAEALAELDALCSLADCASRYSYCRPHVDDGDMLVIRGGRHPVLDAAMRDSRFIPNDTVLDGDDNRMMIITGPNMAGKSTYIRQTALLVIMAQMGSFIPADSAVIGVADKIFTRVGAADDISRGQSTFMVEMLETANILNNATARSLIILDEIGRGTSTFDGLSIAWSVAEYILDHTHARTQFATHYHELTELAMVRQGVKNYNVAVREYGDQIIFLRQIVPGAADKSYGIHVAKLAGLPDGVVSRAKEILANLEENAIGEANLPSVTAAREKRGRYRTKTGGPPQPKPAILQPSLFD